MIFACCIDMVHMGYLFTRVGRAHRVPLRSRWDRDCRLERFIPEYDSTLLIHGCDATSLIHDGEGDPLVIRAQACSGCSTEQLIGLYLGICLSVMHTYIYLTSYI